MRIRHHSTALPTAASIGQFSVSALDGERVSKRKRPRRPCTRCGRICTIQVEDKDGNRIEVKVPLCADCKDADLMYNAAVGA